MKLVDISGMKRGTYLEGKIIKLKSGKGNCVKV
jgi:predicted aconitase with swiveling domain